MSSEKAARVGQRRRARNAPIRTFVRSRIARAKRLIAGNDIPAAEEAVLAAVVALDKAAQKGVLQRNNASRRKSRLMKRLNAAKA